VPAKEHEIASLIQLCGQSPWRKALFTTYTLSLSFFEAYILTVFERMGCGDVLILVDQSFYLESLAERQSKSAGRDYRIVPVCMRTGGAFHPKFTYLWGDHEDFCAIGSGNLTYTGQGSNLECLDVLSSKSDPGSFLDIADFFTAFLDSPSIVLCGERKRLTTYRDRSLKVAGSASPPVRPRVLHSINEPIASQVVRHLKPFHPLNRLVCMAPFHHPVGAPIFGLAEGVGAIELDIGLDPSNLSAPFVPSDRANRSVRTRFVVPGEKDTRRLHAKWYEFHGKTSHLLTGSVNATTRALDTIENVEMAVLRQISRGGALTWIERKPKTVRDGAFTTLSSVFAGVVTATITSQDQLTGEIYGVSAPEGVWLGTVYSRRCEWDLGKITVDSLGTFSCEVPKDLGQLQSLEGAVHIRLRRGKATVAGWIACEFDLDSAPEMRGARRALERLSRGQALPGDILSTIHLICSLLTWQTDSSVGGSRDEAAARAVPPVEADSRRMSHDEWAKPHFRSRGSHGDVSAMLLRALSVLSEGRDALERKAKTRGYRGGASHQADDLDGEYAPSEEYDSILDIIEAIDAVLQRAPGMPMAVEILRARAMLILRPILVRDEDFSLFAAKSRDWLGFVRSLNLNSEYRRKLLGLAWAVAGIAQVLTPPESAAGQMATLKELLESIASGLPETEPRAAAEEALRDESLLDTRPSLRDASLKAINSILSATTIRDQLKTYLSQLSAERRPTPTAALAEAIPGPALAKLNAGTRPTITASPLIDGCPSCFCSLSKLEQSELRTRRAMVCRFCGRVFVWLGN